MTTNTEISRSRGLRSRVRWLLLGLPMLALAGGVMSTAHARGPGHGGPGHEGKMEKFFEHRIGRALEKVNATDDQKARIKAIFEEVKPQMKELRAERKQVRAQMTQALAANPVDVAAVEKLRKQSVQLADRSSSLMTNAMVQSAQVLTPEQRSQIADHMSKKFGKF